MFVKKNYNAYYLKKNYNTYGFSIPTIKKNKFNWFLRLI